MECSYEWCGSDVVFFFQAEDGIRDWSVTGVQTCALPISNGQYRQVFNPYGMQQNRAAPTRGPLWFRKMDRNGDGDVSEREFLGTPEEFKIGRASCRERGEVSAGAGGLRKKRVDGGGARRE